MPNHIHAIVEINVIGDTHGRAHLHDNVFSQDHIHNTTDKPLSVEHTDVPEFKGANEDVPQINQSSLKNHPPGRLPGSISSFIAGFKPAVNSEIDDYIDLHNLNIPKFHRNNHFFNPITMTI